MSKESKYDEDEDWVDIEDSEAISLIQEQEELEENYVVLENCKSEDFINELYKLLRMYDNCFLEGAFVISDDHGKLFDKITMTCLPNKYRGSAVDIITHDIFLNENKFNKMKENKTKLDTDFLKNKLLYFPNDLVFKFFQFENPIKDKSKKEVEMSYLCDPECLQDETNERCTPSRKSIKRVMLFYPFQTIDLVNRSVHRYLYFKLESSSFISVQHAKEAISAYTNPPTVSKSGYPYRRERTTNKSEERYKNILRVNDAKFYNKFNNINVEEIRYYNNNVRSNDELYIPQALTNKILKDIE